MHALFLTIFMHVLYLTIFYVCIISHYIYVRVLSVQILSCNPLDHLPVKMSAMTQLRLLDIDGCPMVTLPEQFRNLPSVSACLCVCVYLGLCVLCV